MQTLLEQHASAAVRVFAVWEPIRVTDFAPPLASVLRRLRDPRVQQYWDSGHRVARRLADDARPPQPVQDCCVQSGVLWDLAAVYPAGARWSDRLPPATVFNGSVVDNVSELTRALTTAVPLIR